MIGISVDFEVSAKAEVIPIKILFGVWPYLAHNFKHILMDTPPPCANTGNHSSVRLVIVTVTKTLSFVRQLNLCNGLQFIWSKYIFYDGRWMQIGVYCWKFNYISWLFLDPSSRSSVLVFSTDSFFFLLLLFLQYFVHRSNSIASFIYHTDFLFFSFLFLSHLFSPVLRFLFLPIFYPSSCPHTHPTDFLFI